MRADILFVFVFKQKTAYEMRISDWSSDVCSSDLMGLTLLPALTTMRKIRAAGLADNACFVMIGGRNDRVSAVEALDAGADDHVGKPRSDERRVGTECVSTCSSRWLPYLSTQKQYQYGRGTGRTDHIKYKSN